MSKVALWVRIPVKPGTRAEAAEAFQFALDHTMQDGGALHYILCEEEADPDAVFVWELYANQEAFLGHASAPWFKEFGEMLAQFATGKPELHFLNPLRGKGL